MIENYLSELEYQLTDSPNHPHIRTFPHHVHIGTEDNVHESEGINVDLFLKQIEHILLK